MVRLDISGMSTREVNRNLRELIQTKGRRSSQEKILEVTLYS